ncbi:MAG: quinone oxidoreductase [Pseudomonadota bacterium]
MAEAQAITLRATGGPAALEFGPLELPELKGGQARIRVEAAGLNFIDIYHRTGLYPVPLPFVPGVEAVGTVEAVGPGVESVSVGDRVGHVGAGGYATHLNAPADRLVPLPDSVDFDTAAAILLKGMTAWMLLFEVRRAMPGETALIWAPVGGVGSLLVPWARSLGVDVLAVTSTEEKAETARALGANEVAFRDQDVAAAARAFTGGAGVDVAYDSVGKSSQEASLNSLKPRGWWISYGNASGPAVAVDPGRLGQLGSLIMTRPALFSYIDTRDALLRGASAVFGALVAGTLAPRIEATFPLSEAAEAQSMLESGRTQGALLLKPNA